MQPFVPATALSAFSSMRVYIFSVHFSFPDIRNKPWFELFYIGDIKTRLYLESEGMVILLPHKIPTRGCLSSRNNP